MWIKIAKLLAYLLVSIALPLWLVSSAIHDDEKGKISSNGHLDSLFYFLAKSNTVRNQDDKTASDIASIKSELSQIKDKIATLDNKFDKLSDKKIAVQFPEIFFSTLKDIQRIQKYRVEDSMRLRVLEQLIGGQKEQLSSFIKRYKEDTIDYQVRLRILEGRQRELDFQIRQRDSLWNIEKKAKDSNENSRFFLWHLFKL